MVNWNPGKRGGGDTKISKEIITKIVSKFDENYNLRAPCEARQTSSTRNWSKTILKPIIIKLLKMNGKEKISQRKDILRTEEQS